MSDDSLVIPKTWRSEFPRLVYCAVSAFGSVYLSGLFPWTIIDGPLFSFGDSKVMLSLPLLWFFPVYFACRALYRIYNVRFAVDSKGIESKIGILSLNQTITRIRFEDVRSIETEQTLFERFLNIGLVEMGTAATAGLEMIFEGVANPTEVQRMLQNERDARIKNVTSASSVTITSKESARDIRVSNL